MKGKTPNNEICQVATIVLIMILINCEEEQPILTMLWTRLLLSVCDINLHGYLGYYLIYYFVLD